MLFLAPIVFLGILIFWLYAECKLNRAIRIIGGLGCIILVAVSAHLVTMIIPHYESSFHRRSIKKSSELIANGDTQRVQQAFQLYNAIATNNDSAYRASMEMWQALNQGTNQLHK